jgi:hypothetical protein
MIDGPCVDSGRCDMIQSDLDDGCYSSIQRLTVLDDLFAWARHSKHIIFSFVRESQLAGREREPKTYAQGLGSAIHRQDVHCSQSKATLI